MISRKIKSAAIAATLVLGAASAHAAPTTGLYLAMDGSGSISSADFTTQVSAYTNALTTFFAVNPTAYGQVVIGGDIFGANMVEFFAPTEIANATDLASLTSAISALDPSRAGINTGATDIGDAILQGMNSLSAYKAAHSAITDFSMVVDVTTDGGWNTGPNPNTTAFNNEPPLTAVNCLGLGPAADCSFVTNSNVVGTDYGQVGFSAMEAALTNKIQTEVIGTPEPASMAILSMALLGLGAARRRR